MEKTGENMWYDVCTTIQWNKSRYPKLFISTYVGRRYIHCFDKVLRSSIDNINKKK